jgi:hypothetical protein
MIDRLGVNENAISTKSTITMNSKNEKVQIFLNELMLADPYKYDSLISMRRIVFNEHPETSERIMYGGIMFSLNSEDFGGLYVSKNHISFEFGKGFLLEDPNGFLEGSGKFRRHIKIRQYEDIAIKEVVTFVKQVGSL